MAGGSSGLDSNQIFTGLGGNTGFGGVGEAPSAVRAAAAAQAGLVGQGGVSPEQKLSREAAEQQIKMRKQIMDLLLGSKGSAGLLAQSSGGGGIGDLLSQMEGYGSGERASINQGFQNVGNTAVANLERRGLGASNLVGSTMQGVERNKQLALGELGDRVMKEKIGVQERGMDRALQSKSLLINLLGGLV